MSRRQKSLKQKAASGMLWTAIQRYSKMFISFISGIILARLLTPYDYGCIGMLNIFMVLAESFIDGGFGSALIQKKNPTQVDYSTIFWWNVMMSIVMYAILYVSAPAIARFYDIPILCDVLRVQGLVLFIYALNIIQRNQLRKKLNFRILSLVTIITSLITLAVTVVMAYMGFGVWALVANNLLGSFIPSLIFWFYVRWRPQLMFSCRSFKELFSFGFYMFLTHLLNRFGQQIQGLLIGKFYNPATMGYYSKAHSTERLASTSISHTMTEVTYPLYAEVQDDKVKLGNMIRRLTMTLAYITFPLMFILLLCAKPIFVLLYSDRWLQSVPYFQILCIAGLAYCLQAVNLQSISAIGKSRTMFWFTFLKRSIGIGLMVVGLIFWGMKGLLCAVVFNNWFAYLVNIWLVDRHIGYRMKNQIIDILPMLFMSALAAGVAYCAGELMNVNMYVDGTVKLVVCVGIYVVWSVVRKPESYKYFLSIIDDMLKKRRTK